MDRQAGPFEWSTLQKMAWRDTLSLATSFLNSLPNSSSTREKYNSTFTPVLRIRALTLPHRLGLRDLLRLGPSFSFIRGFLSELLPLRRPPH